MTLQMIIQYATRHDFGIPWKPKFKMFNFAKANLFKVESKISTSHENIFLLTNEMCSYKNMCKIQIFIAKETPIQALNE